jgi:hypothetical protein
MQMNTGNQTGQNRTNTTNDTSVGVFNEKKKLPPHSHAHFFPTDVKTLPIPLWVTVEEIGIFIKKLFGVVSIINMIK